MKMTPFASLAGLRGEHVGIVASAWVRFSLRTGTGILTLLFVVVAGLIVAAAFTSPIEMLMKEAPDLGHTAQEAATAADKVARSDAASRVVGWITGEDPTEVEWFLRRNPALLSLIFLIFLLLLPFEACLAGANQTAGDIGSRGLRYLLLRTERPNLFFGRFLGVAAFMMVCIAVVVAIILLYVGVKFRIYAWGEMLVWSLVGYVAAIALVLPYLALASWVSAMVDSPAASIALSLLLAGLPILLLNGVDTAIAGNQSWLDRLTPWGWKFGIVGPDWAGRILALLALGGFTILFLFLGARHFGKRDL